jgi:Domain of unknown function (DUF4126)
LPTQIDTTHLLAVAAALGWASGLRFYAVVFITGLVGSVGWVDLPAGLRVLQSPLVLGASGFMLVVEFLADKIPALDSFWDIVHTIVRVPGGAALAAAVFGVDHGAMAVIAGLLGGTLAAVSHTAKSTTRTAANTSPEPFSNLGLSLLDDVAAPLSLWLAWTHPWIFFGVLAVVVAVMIAVTWVLGRFLLALVRRAARWFAPEGVAG